LIWEAPVFGLVVRFTCKDEASAEAFDQLVAATIEQIQQHEPGTLVYASHKVEGRPLMRIFYELYRDRAAFDAHEQQEHTKHFLRSRDLYVASYEVDWLSLQAGKGTTG
jgi:quinol monooxygenase YgiN